jgi:hypothetical protein
MKVGDLVICTSAETGKEKLGVIFKIMGTGWYKVLLEDGTSAGVWSKEYMRKVRNVYSNRK